MSESENAGMYNNITIRRFKDNAKTQKVNPNRSEFEPWTFDEYKQHYPISVHLEKSPPWKEGDAQPFVGELLLDADIKKMVSDRTRSANQLMVSYNNHIDRWLDDAARSILEARLAETRFEQQAKLVWSEGGLERSKDRKRYHDAKTTYETFRERNHLTRPAKVPTSSSTAFKWALVVLLVIVEAALNTSLFATNLEGGLLDGFWNAFLMSLINVALALAIGRFIMPYKNHVNLSKSAIGYTVLLLWLLLEVVFALFVAHYRDAMQMAEIEQAFKLSLGAMRDEFFSLSDVTSYILCFVTFAFGLIALFDGYLMRDIYPGYTKEQKLYDEELQAWEDSIQEARDALEVAKNMAIQSLDEQLRFAEEQLQKVEMRIGEKQHLMDAYDHFSKHALSLRDSCIAEYRVLRGDTVTPATVKHPLELEKINTLTTVQDNQQQLYEKEAELSALKQQSNELKQSIIVAYDKACETLALEEDQTHGA